MLCLTNRYYDPGTARFLTRDPIGYEGGINLYAFCAGNPINKIDPFGTNPPGGFDPGEIIKTVGGKESLIFAPAATPAARALLIPGVAQAVTIILGAEAVYEMCTYQTGKPSGPFTWIGQQIADHCYPLPYATVGYYDHLNDPKTVGPGKKFTTKQINTIYNENIKRNGGVLKDDVTGEELVRSTRHKKGQTPPANSAQVDHIVPRKPQVPGVIPGTNSYKNAAVRSMRDNRAKSNKE